MAPVIHLWALVLGHARIIMEYLLLYLCFLSLIFHSDLNKLVQIKSVFACTVMEFHPSDQELHLKINVLKIKRYIWCNIVHQSGKKTIQKMQSFSSPSLFGRK